jgi:NADH dehydrogenase/NADH:ubiquinone oxidoreductase subunit G
VSTIGDVALNETGSELVKLLYLTGPACISCGQCTSVCPVGALTEKSHIHPVQKGLKHKQGKHYHCTFTKFFSQARSTLPTQHLQ